MIAHRVSISGMISPTLRFQGMGEFIKHECGLALVRQLKAPEYYYDKYGSLTWGASKLHVLMQKQRNRGQDGAGIATVKLNAASWQTLHLPESDPLIPMLLLLYLKIGTAKCNNV